MCRFRCLTFEAAVVAGGRDPDPEALRLDVADTQLEALDDPPMDDPLIDDPPELEREVDRYDDGGGCNVVRFAFV